MPIDEHTNNNLPVLQQIVEWSKTRPLWQRDALRRIVTQNGLTQQDYDQLVLICKQQRNIGIQDIPLITPIPLSENDIPQSSNSSSTLKIKSLSSLRGINALTTDSVLKFGTSGLTVIYGDNATGKSGYVRLLKQLCRVRGSRDQILPNIFDIISNVIAEAEINYSLNDNDTSIHWSTNLTSPTEFREVSIFDELSAGVYVDENCDVAYLPFGLDILPRLADSCNEMSRRIRLEISQLDSYQFIPNGIPIGTYASSIIERLDQINIQDELLEFASFGLEEQKRLREINLTISRLTADNPQTRAVELRTRANRFRNLRQTFENFISVLSNERINEFNEAIRLQKSRETAFTILQTQSFSNEVLPGIGTETWRALWEAARQYSELNLPQSFPPTGQGSLCVLCLQPLGQLAIERFQRFDNFVRTTIQTEVIRSRQMTNQLRQNFQNISSVQFLTSDTFEELHSFNNDNAIILKRAQESIFLRRQEIISTDFPESINNLTPLPNPPLAWLTGIENQLMHEANTLSSAINPTEQNQLLNEEKELIGKQKLTEVRSQILNEINRRILLSSLKGCIQDTNTTGITHRNTELTDNALIKVLSKKFSEHLTALNVQHTSASICPAPGEYGIAYHKVEIKARQQVKASDILSRGEHRAIAIAAFLAELETQQSASTIIFDDPVSSLDQDRRGYVASSLVSLCRNRPIIIFTHDLYFLYLLREKAAALGVELTSQFLKRDREKVGIVSEGFPWIGQNIRERIGVLKQRVQQAEVL